MDNYQTLRASEESIEKHRRFYWELLAKGQEVKLATLLPTYEKMQPALHQDSSVLDYVLDRLPATIQQTKKVFLGQNRQDFEKVGLKLDLKQPETAKARRHWWFFDAQNQALACFLASPSDVDDLVNLLLAYQLEEKKKGKQPDLSLRLLSHTWAGYRRVAQEWWEQVKQGLVVSDLRQVPLYFVSSNLHALVNIVGGFVQNHQLEIFGYIDTHYPSLYQEWLKVKVGENPLRANDFLYYISKIYFQDQPDKWQEKVAFEESLGIRQTQVSCGLLAGAQLIPLTALANSPALDPHLVISNRRKLAQSKAFILNVDYPLGFAAYFLLAELLENLEKLKGVYLVGKAAVLAGKVGDIQLPGVVFDERTSNIFLVNNVFNRQFPFKTLQSNVLSEQKSISVYGTFLENQAQLQRYAAAGFNIIEMENGPYLTALAEVQLARQFPQNTVLSFDQLPLELGIINYASDSPLAGKTLSGGSLALKGVEPTYLALLSVLQRIIKQEEAF